MSKIGDVTLNFDWCVPRENGDKAPTRQQRLMQGLVYPAVLGACLVWFLQALPVDWEVIRNTALADDARLNSFLRVAFGSWLIVYFAVPFTRLSEQGKKKYLLGSFLVDLAEVIVIFLFFNFAGLVAIQAPPNPPNYFALYLLILFIPILAGISRLLVGFSPYVKLGMTGLIVAIVGMAFLSGGVALNLIGILVLWILLGFYLLCVSRETPSTKPHHKTNPA